MPVTALAPSLTSRGIPIKKKIDALTRHNVTAIIEIGADLLAVQADLAHHGDGTFQRFVKEAVGVSTKTAYNYMNLAGFLKDRVKITQSFDPAAVYLLTADAAPEAAEAEAVQRAEAGERITPKVAKEIIKRHSEPKVDEPEAEAPPDPDAWLEPLAEPYGTAVTAINLMLRVLGKLAGDEATGMYLKDGWSGIQVQLLDVKRIISQLAPYAEHKDCGGKGCKGCRKTGYLTKFGWGTLPTEQRE